MFLLVIALIIAFSLSFFQYLYKSKRDLKQWILFFLRTLSVFFLLFLLINPYFNYKKEEISKPTLAIVADNSNSIEFLNYNKVSNKVYNQLITNSKLKEKFELIPFSFDKEVYTSYKNDFKGTSSNINLLSSELKNYLPKQDFHQIVLLTDGNQTQGNDFSTTFSDNCKVFPVVLGDTAYVQDIKIDQLNVNKFALHRNKFPVEIFVSHNIKKSTSAILTIKNGNSTVLTKNVNLDVNKNSYTENVIIEASKVGVQKYSVTISSSVNEKNKINNTQFFAIDVINQKNSIALVSDFLHPDLGAFKRAIEKNELRKVDILKINDFVLQSSKYNVVILYQPNFKYNIVLDKCIKNKTNTFFITGTQTDYNFLNQKQNFIKFQSSDQKESYFPIYNPDFSYFSSTNFGFENLPPLQNKFIQTKINSNVSVLLTSKVNGIDTGQPLLVYGDSNWSKSVFLLGENSWKWRSEQFVSTKSFNDYDAFIDKTIQFLATTTPKTNLKVEFQNLYNAGESINIQAQIFNKNLELDENAQLEISVKGKNSFKKYGFIKGNESYNVNLDGLPSGIYSFTVYDLKSKEKFTNTFEILPFDQEKQFVNAAINKLNQLANLTQGKSYMPNQVSLLIDNLIKDASSKPIIKTSVKNEPLIDWWWVVLSIILLLSLEWFLRKYHGLL